MHPYPMVSITLVPQFRTAIRAYYNNRVEIYAMLNANNKVFFYYTFFIDIKSIYLFYIFS